MLLQTINLHMESYCLPVVACASEGLKYNTTAQCTRSQCVLEQCLQETILHAFMGVGKIITMYGVLLNRWP